MVMVEADMQPQDMNSFDMWQIGLAGVIDQAYKTELNQLTDLKASKNLLVGKVRSELSTILDKMKGVYKLLERFESEHGAFRFESGLAFFQKKLTFDAEGILAELAREAELTQERIKQMGVAKETKLKNILDSVDRQIATFFASATPLIQSQDQEGHPVLDSSSASIQADDQEDSSAQDTSSVSLQGLNKTWDKLEESKLSISAPLNAGDKLEAAIQSMHIMIGVEKGFGIPFEYPTASDLRAMPKDVPIALEEIAVSEASDGKSFTGILLVF